MKINNDCCGQLCYMCEEPIHGTGLLVDAVFNKDKVFYHPDCYETSVQTMHLIMFYHWTVFGRAADWITWAEETVGVGQVGATGTILEEITGVLDNENMFSTKYCVTCWEDTVFYPNDTCSLCGGKETK